MNIMRLAPVLGLAIVLAATVCRAQGPYYQQYNRGNYRTAARYATNGYPSAPSQGRSYRDIAFQEDEPPIPPSANDGPPRDGGQPDWYDDSRTSTEREPAQADTPAAQTDQTTKRKAPEAVRRDDLLLNGNYLDPRCYRVPGNEGWQGGYAASGSFGTYNWGYGDDGTHRYYGGSHYPGNPYHYDRWRPWWGGVCGWGPYHGASGYPAYRCSPHSGYFFRPCMYPPKSYYYGYPNYEGGYTQYPRTFVYDWSPDKGDTSPRPEMAPQND